MLLTELKKSIDIYKRNSYHGYTDSYKRLGRKGTKIKKGKYYGAYNAFPPANISGIGGSSGGISSDGAGSGGGDGGAE